MLLQMLQSSIQQQGRMTLVEGDAGVGKTRLIQEFVTDAKWHGWEVAASKADPLADAAPYQLLRDALAPLLTPLRFTQLAELVAPPDLAAIAPLFPVLLEHLPDLAGLPPQQTSEGQERLWEGLEACLDALSSIAPLLLVLEDIHWADEASLATLPKLARHLSSAPIPMRMALSCRPFEAQERAIVWNTLQTLDHSALLQRLPLTPLEEAEAVALVRRALGVSHTDVQASTFAGRLWEKTGGNVLFLVETLKLLLEAGAIEPSTDVTGAGNAWTLPAADLTLPTPASVQALISERLARLTPALRDTLEQSAVLGEDTEFPVLLHAGGPNSPAEDLARRLRRLHRRGFLAETETGYRFEHDLTREVIYQAIDSERRASLHRRAANALEAHHPERVESLARHFYRGDVADKALAYSLQAGERAVEVYDYESALDDYRRAEMLAGVATERWDVLARREEALAVLARREEQGQVLDRMLRLAQTLNDPVRRARTLYRQGWREVLAGKPTTALSLLQEAGALARANDERDLLGTCLTAIARAWWRLGDTPACQATVEEAYDLFQETGHSEGESEALNMLGNLHLGMTGDFARALRYFQALQQRAAELGDRYKEATARCNIGITYNLLGVYERSQETLAQALQVMVQAGDRRGQSVILHCQGVNYWSLGDLDRAHKTAQEALEICQEIGNHNFEIEALRLLGLVALDGHQAEQARHYFQTAVEIAEANGQKIDWALNQSHLALAYLHQGRTEEARRLSEQAVLRMKRLEEPTGYLKDVYFERCQIIAATEGPEAARPDLARAYRHLMDMADQIEDPDLRCSFLENEPRNRAIITAYRRGCIPPPPRQLRIALPRADAPTGRPLREDEYVQVSWTVTAPEDAATSGTVARRRQRLMRLLREATQQGAAPPLDILAETLDVSQRTLKRDLAALRAQGHTIRTRGTRSG